HDTDPDRTFSGDARGKFGRAQQIAMGEEITMSSEERIRLYRQPLFLTQSYGSIWRVTDLLGLDASDEAMRLGFNAYIILFSLATVVLVFLLGQCISGDRVQALFGALLIATFPVNVVGSLYVKEDIPLMFWFTAAITGMAFLVQNGRKKYYLWTGLLVGMAVATKYTGLLLLPIYFLAHLMVVFQVPKGHRIRAFFPWQLFAGFGLGLLAFLIFNPHVLTHWPDFWQGFLYQVEYARDGHQDGTAIGGPDYWWTFYLRYAIVPGITILVTVFFLGGLVLSFVKRNRAAILVSVTVLLVYFQFENSLAKPFPFFARYLHIIYPLMAVLAALAFFELWRHLQRNRSTQAIGVFIGVLLVLLPLAKSTILVAGARPDTRILAVEWMEENLPAGSRIYLGSRSYSPHHFQAGLFELQYDPNVHRKSVQSLIEEDTDYLVVSSFQYDRYRFSWQYTDVARQAYEGYQAFERELKLVKEFQPQFSFQSYGQHNPVIRIYEISPVQS
ncbi:MAG: glycosyltransferase family 39 protein, partial [Chloroflexota bacterium]